MKAVGIICEYNPMHRGHEEMIKKLREREECTVVCLMSGNFVQRGEPAILDKYDRAAAAVRSGADLVLELPFPWSAGSARYFAEAGVFILNAVGVKSIAFGSESADAALLSEAAEMLIRGEHDLGGRDNTQGVAAEYFSALNSRLGIAGRLQPNDILGLEYMRAARMLDTDIDLTVIKREGAGYLDPDTASGYPSSTALRAAILRGELPRGLTDASADILTEALKNGSAPATLDALGQAILYRFRSWDGGRLAEFAECGGGVSGRLCRAARVCGTSREMLRRAATKRYTDARLRRAVLFALTKVVRRDLLARPAYTSMLAADEKGRGFLASLRRTARIPVLTRPSEAQDVARNNTAAVSFASRQTELLLACEAVYALSTPKPRPAGDFMRRTPLCLQNSD